MNFRHIFANHYEVYNQNGFNNALYHYFNDRDKVSIRQMVQNYPTHYPCEIYIFDNVSECSRIHIASPDGKLQNKM